LDYLSEYFGREMYLKSYTPIIYLVPSEEQWVRTNQLIIEPPEAKATIGRPKKNVEKERLRGQQIPTQ
jgi:hypothetical protein